MALSSCQNSFCGSAIFSFVDNDDDDDDDDDNDDV